MKSMKNTISKGTMNIMTTMNTQLHFTNAFTNLFTHVTRARLNNILRLATLTAACLALTTHALAQSSCPADLNGDGEVDSSDLGSFLLVYGPCPTQSSCPADLNGDGEVDSSDLGSFLLAYGPCPEPTISAVTPNTGATTGGRAITITGTNLTGATSVQVGSGSATSVVVVNDTTVTAVTPSGSLGAKNVTVTSTGGTATLVGAFTYVIPSAIYGVSPNTGPTQGGTVITITGKNLTGATSVQVGSGYATSVLVVNSTTLTAVTPSGTLGTKNITVTTAGGTITLVGAFTYVIPTTISAVSPNAGPIYGGTAITITGKNLTAALSVQVGSGYATSVFVVNDTTLIAVTPSGTASESAQNITVFTEVGSVTLYGSFYYVDPPTISSISPNNGPIEGGTLITITGTNITGEITVQVGSGYATDVRNDEYNTITAVTPSGTAGARNVIITCTGGSGTLTGGFTYDGLVPPWYTILEQAPNAAVVLNPYYRNKIVASGLPWRVRDNSSGIEMVLIPEGYFYMGCSPSYSYICTYEGPVHSVMLGGFYVGRTEVTQAQWQAKMGNNPSYFSGNANNPVEQVSWNDCQQFCAKTNLRLLTEAQWEYAYRAGDPTLGGYAFHSMPGYPNGTNDDNLLGNIAWYDSNNSPSGTKPVAGKAANAFGLYDMSGNVWELCNDWYAPYAEGQVTNPAGPSTGNSRVSRGGGWNSNSGSCRSSYRGLAGGPDFSSNGVGFRVARTP